MQIQNYTHIILIPKHLPMKVSAMITTNVC